VVDDASETLNECESISGLKTVRQRLVGNLRGGLNEMGDVASDDSSGDMLDECS